MAGITYLTGPVRSGKSRRAVQLAATFGPDVVFVATWRPDPADPEMAERVRRHQAERPSWRTFEAPADVVAALALVKPPPSAVVVDCLTLWLGDRFGQPDDAILAQWSAQLTGFRAAPWPVIIVGNEIGWSPVPPDGALRRFRDLAGTLAQQTVAVADDAWLMVAGCALRLK